MIHPGDELLKRLLALTLGAYYTDPEKIVPDMPPMHYGAAAEVLRVLRANLIEEDPPSRLTVVPDHVWRYQQGSVHLPGCCVHPSVPFSADTDS